MPRLADPAADDQRLPNGRTFLTVAAGVYLAVALLLVLLLAVLVGGLALVALTV